MLFTNNSVTCGDVRLVIERCTLKSHAAIRAQPAPVGRWAAGSLTSWGRQKAHRSPGEGQWPQSSQNRTHTCHAARRPPLAWKVGSQDMKTRSHAGTRVTVTPVLISLPLAECSVQEGRAVLAETVRSAQRREAHGKTRRGGEAEPTAPAIHTRRAVGCRLYSRPAGETHAQDFTCAKRKGTENHVPVRARTEQAAAAANMEQTRIQGNSKAERDSGCSESERRSVL